MRKSLLSSGVLALATFSAVVLSSSIGVTATGKQGKDKRAKAKQVKVAQPVVETMGTKALVAPATELLTDIKATPVPAAKDELAVKPETKKTEAKAVPSGPSRAFVATAYSLKGRMANGRGVHKGAIAADPRVLPLGTRVYLNAGSMSGEYVVADTGGAIKGRRIDIWTPSRGQAIGFGRRGVQLTVISGRRASGADNAQSAAPVQTKAKRKK